MLEALVKSRNSLKPCDFNAAPATYDIFSRRDETFANQDLQLGDFSFFTRRASFPFMKSCLQDQQRPLEAKFGFPRDVKGKIEGFELLELSASNLKNVVLLGELKDLLSKGELLKARHILEKSLLEGQRFSEPLQKLNEALSLEEVATRAVISPQRKDEATWIKTNRAAYKGKWVALLGDQVVASGDTFKELIAVVRRKYLSPAPVIHHVE